MDSKSSLPLLQNIASNISMASALHPRPLRDFYPTLTPYSQGFLQVDATHSLYWEQSGNPDGIPVFVFHGGPGAGATPTHRRFFDPNFYRIVIFDQRGAGRSYPLGSLENNTLEHLVQDTEKLRKHLNIEKMHLFGGSWGSTLALSYAQIFPQNCLSLILRSIFLMEQSEIDWFMIGMKTIFPEFWDQFSSYIPPEEQQDLLTAYYKRLTSPSDKIAIEAALAWNDYESQCSSFFPAQQTITNDEQRFYALAMAKIEAHYFKTQVLSPSKSLLRGIDAVRAIPATIIHGRYDIVCPIQNAHRLHIAWPEADYVVVADAGHSFQDPTMRSRLIEACDHAKRL
jgi:proline iminopeptidase